MWSDNETAQDFLNFGTVAKTVAEIIESAHARPISIGVSGAWGVGKSSLIKLIRAEVEKSRRPPLPQEIRVRTGSSSLNLLRGCTKGTTMPELHSSKSWRRPSPKKQQRAKRASIRQPSC